MRPHLPTILAVLALAGLMDGHVSAQLQLPRLPDVGGVVGNPTGTLEDTLANADRLTVREARRLRQLRDQTLARLLRLNSDVIERDAAGDLARRGELLAIDASAAQLVPLEQAGFRLLGREQIAGLGIEVVRLRAPAGLSLAEAQARAAQLVSELELSADNLHFEAEASTSVTVATPAAISLAAAQTAPINAAVGVIDGAPGTAVAVSATKGFAKGAPFASDHGSAVASLLRATGIKKLWVADVYG